MMRFRKTKPEPVEMFPTEVTLSEKRAILNFIANAYICCEISPQDHAFLREKAKSMPVRK